MSTTIFLKNCGVHPRPAKGFYMLMREAILPIEVVERCLTR